MTEFTSKWRNFSGKRLSMLVAKVAKGAFATFATLILGHSGENISPPGSAPCLCDPMSSPALVVGVAPPCACGKAWLCRECLGCRSCRSLPGRRPSTPIAQRLAPETQPQQQNFENMPDTRHQEH